MSTLVKHVRLLMVLLVVVLLISIGNLLSVEALNSIFTDDQYSQLYSLFKRRESMSSSLNNIKDQLVQVSASKDLAYQLTLSSDMTDADHYSAIGGVRTDDFVALTNLFTLQMSELTNQTNSLYFKKKILESAISLLDTQIIQLSSNGSSVNHFASSNYGTAVLKSNGSIVYIGYYDSTINNQGVTLVDTTSRFLKTPVLVDMSPIPGKTVIDIQATGQNNFVILTLDGQVWGWGQNVDNALGTGSSGTQIKMVKADVSGIYPAVEIKKMKCAYYANGCFLITSDGRLLYMGEFFLTNAVSPSVNEKLSRPKVIPTIGDGISHTVSDAAFGSSSTPAIKSFCFLSSNNSKVYCVGDNTYGQLGDGTYTSRLTSQTSSSISWAPVISDQKFIKLVGGANYFAAVSTEGKIYTWGIADYRMARPFGIPYPLSNIPGMVTLFPHHVKSICAASSRPQIMFTDFNNNVYVMGTYDNIDIGAPYKPIHLDGRQFSEISCGDYVMFAQPMSSNYVFAWGKNNNYQLGIDTSITTAKTAFFEATNIPTIKV